MKILTVKKKVAEIMTVKPETRDNDFYLMYWVWKEEFDSLPFLAKQDLKIDFDKTNIINLLRESIEEEDWRIVEQVVEMLNVEIDNPFDEYEKDEDIEDF